MYYKIINYYVILSETKNLDFIVLVYYVGNLSFYFFVMIQKSSKKNLAKTTCACFCDSLS